MKTALTAPYVNLFLNNIDRCTEIFGLNVSQIVDLHRLRSLPSGSFGRAWADFLIQKELSPFTTGARRKQLHDGVHVLTGYDTDPIGEIELQAFLLGAKFHPIHLILILGLSLSLYRQVKWTNSLISQADIKHRIQQAYARGINSNFDIDRWQPEFLWSLSLAEVYQMFGLHGTFC